MYCNKKIEVAILAAMMFSVLIGNGCRQNVKHAETVVIEMKFDNGIAKKVVLEEITEDQIVKIDSVVLDDRGGAFFRIALSTPKFLLLRFENNDFIPLLANKNEKISITADMRNVGMTFSATGNSEVTALSQYFKRLFSDININDSLGNILKKLKDVPEFSKTQHEVIARHQILFDAHKQYAESLIRQHPEYLSNLLIINQFIGNRRFFELREDTAIYFLVDKTLWNHYANNKHVIKLHERITAFKQELAAQQIASERLQAGNKAPDFSLPDLKGKIVNLYDFQGNIVVLSFWSSWEKGTPQYLEMLKTMYLDYHNSQVVFIAISMDEDEQQWRQAVKSQHVEWLQLSDLKGASSPLVQLYNLKNDLPVYYVIDRTGIILLQTPTMAAIDDLLYRETRKKAI